ncbi:DUF998 domain-containing protein [Flavobacterium quisquiliarum]|uniref:DUF998 domain-containing protein n=1 Tax=Flavobacterium quisquiliarum TaxID=1834436 RepID=A0ABV8W4A8_9FLAO|nr:DUF998 domain-containing protein [Flavobacterium quisquiliarum]MBW1654618.1 DUF998 domain-containing protein [Flavobacterium quisquiliarum]NWL01695.1 hypothetical protein [Flavobacterium collinsii]
MNTKQSNWFKIAALLCIIVCIADFIVLFVLGNYYPGYSHLRNTMSSLGASASPVSAILSTWWIGIGIAFVFFGFQFRKAFDSNAKNVKIASGLIVLYGLGEGIGSGIFKADRIRGKMTNSFIMHDIAGGIGLIAALLLPLFMHKVILKKENPLFYRLSWIVFITGIITMLLFTIHFSSGETNVIIHYKGLWQRLFLLNLYVYFIVISIIMYHRKSIV